MKIRINGNSVRLRLSQSEVIQFVNEGIVSSSCNLGGGRLTYQIKKGDFPTIFANMENQTISINIPNNLADHWDTDFRVGFDNMDSRGLYILVEKDFQCLKPRINEDESDLFPNPQAITNSYD